MKKVLLLLIAIMAASTASAQPREGYYTSVLDGKSGRQLELAVQSIVRPHKRVRYDDLWDAFPITDPGPVDSIPASYMGDKTDLVYDMYAWMGQFTKFYSDKNHTQTGGFNREHAVPNSWWGGKAGNTYAYSDLHHLTPADGCANSVAKNDYPLGEHKEGMTLGWPVATKTNSSGYTYVTADTSPDHKGSASHRWGIPSAMREEYGGATNVFEPADEYKGDFARMYFYVVCTYEGELYWRTNYMFETDEAVPTDSLTNILPWAKELLLKWHRQDPVSRKELDRNNAVESLQANRNPFIDYPELVEHIWGDSSTNGFDLASAQCAYNDYSGVNAASTTEPIIHVYNLQGNLLYTGAPRTDVSTLGHGMLIIRQGESVRKVVR